MTAKERIAAARVCNVHKPEHHTRICEPCMLAAFRAHTNAALEEAAKVAYIELRNLSGPNNATAVVIAVAIRALREGE